METAFKYMDGSRFNNFVMEGPILPPTTNTTTSTAKKGGILDTIKGFLPGFATGLGTNVISNLGPKTGISADIQSVCGRKPLLNLGGKKDAYNACAQKYAADVNAANIAAANAAANQSNSGGQMQSAGLSTGAWIAISATGLVVISGIVFLIVKNK